jgi:mannosyl-oligosaccharide alpha-1,3-glucosidase
LWNKDWFKHPVSDEAVNLYSSIPYITSHSSSLDTSMIWHNAAETWVEILKTNDNQKMTNFMSVSGQIEFYLFGSSRSPKQVLKKLADLTGYAPMPPLFSLGFHFSKWSTISANLLRTRNVNFEFEGIPLDYLWMDIPHTDRGKYFTFNSALFPNETHEELNA